MTDTPDKSAGANMSDETAWPDESGGGRDAPDHGARFDDDRLLAYAIGLEDDLELEAALPGDDALQRRLAAVEAGIDDVGAGLDRLVPAPGDDYADPAAARWDGLRPFLAPPPERRPSRGRWRVLVPVLGAILAIAVVGAFALRDGSGDSQMAGDRGAGSTESLGAPAAETDAAKAAYGAEALAADLELYETAFLARAGEIEGTTQHFTVIRRIKGLVTDDIYFEVMDRPLEPDTLAVVLLGAASDEQATSGAGSDAVLYDYQGIEVLVRPLPPDVDPAEVVP